MNIPWDPVDEQRLLAYKKEGKSWKWIFRQFSGKSHPAVRTRLNIVLSVSRAVVPIHEKGKND
jgi:hypothetical protein